MAEILTPQLAALAAVAFLAGLVRGFSGFGAGLLMAPWFLIVLGPARAVPVLVALELVASARLVPGVARKIERRSTALLAVPACLSVPLGSALLIALDPVPVRRAVSMAILVFVAALASGWHYKKRPPALLMASTGAMSGVLSGFGGVGGPPIVLLLVSGPQPAERNRATLIVFFALTQSTATAVFAWHGMLDGAVLLHVAALSPLFLAGTHLGAVRFQPGRERLYRAVALTLVAISGIAGLV